MMTTVSFCSSAQPCAIMETSKNIEMKKKIIELIDYFGFCQNGQTSTSFSGKRKPDVSGIQDQECHAEGKKSTFNVQFRRKEQTIHLHLCGLILPNCYTISTKENHVMSLNDVVTELYISNANE